MKKNILLLPLLLLLPFLSYSQIEVDGKEGFENGIPSNWTVKDNAVGITESWGITTTPPAAVADIHSGVKAAQILREPLNVGQTSEDWLITPLLTIGSKRQLRFFSRSQLNGDTGTKYRIMISPLNPVGPPNLSTFSEIKTYTELELSADPTIYEEKIVSLGDYAGDTRYIAFVRVFTRLANTSGAFTGGDKWLLDDINIVEQCINPDTLGASGITGQKATLGWNYSASDAKFDVEYGAYPFAPGSGVGYQETKDVQATFVDVSGLPPNTLCSFYVRAKCSSGGTSEWEGPYLFQTKPMGTICAEPKLVSSLPYQVKGDNTHLYGDNFDFKQGTSCGGSPSTTNYFEGDDVFYSYTATSGGKINITMTPLGTGTASNNSSLFVYDGCSNVPATCLAGMANVQNMPRILTLDVVAGKTYIIAISSSAATQSITYDLLIQREDCVPKPTDLTATTTLNTAALGWTDVAGHTSWEVAVQPFGSGVPSGNGNYKTENPVTVNSLIGSGDPLASGTQYQYWVRAECSKDSNDFTGWAGPFVFSTQICDQTNDACAYVFRMTDSAANGWQGAQMEVRQNGIVVATIGSTFTSTEGAGPVDIAVPLCKDIPFDLFWSVTGTQPQQCAVTVLNSFGQTIYNMPAGSVAIQGTVIPPGIIYTGAVNCSAPRCDISPVNLTADANAHSAILTWNAPATYIWDIYIVKKGDSAPIPSTTPTYDNFAGNPDASGNVSFTTTIPLDADTDYVFYVRVDCGGSEQPSVWSSPGSFHTLATCPKPSALTVPSVVPPTTTDPKGSPADATVLGWTAGYQTDSSWDILLVPSTSATPPVSLPPANPSFPGQIFIQDGVNGDVVNFPPNPPSYAYTYPLDPVKYPLVPATIYYYYVRTNCAGNDKSVWAGPIVFNTILCNDSDKCEYKFILTDLGNNGWNQGKMQVRQNGIVVTNIGPTILGGGPTTVKVKLCTGVPFDLYWSAPGTFPDEIGLTIQNPFTDLLYTKVPGIGNPLEVLYSSTADCAPPTCPKPTGMKATNVGSTTADLSWTEMGSAQQWEVYAAPTGAPAPVNGSPLHGGVLPYYDVFDTSGINPKTVTLSGLDPVTSYTYYVRAVCSGGSDVGTWTILNPVTFVTKPLNDECSGAVPVTVNSGTEVVFKVSGNTLGATATSPAPAPICPGTPDDDVWYSFVASAPTHVIALSNIVGNTIDLNHTLYKGTDCASMTQVYCSNPNFSVASNLTVGDTYFIRVYTQGSVSGQSATFDLGITTPAPVTNDECATALPAAVNTGMECKVVTPGSLAGATASVDSSTCIGSEDDDVWYAFQATATTHYFTLAEVKGTTNDLNFAVYSGTCGNLFQMFCSPSNSLLANNSNFVVGQTYYVRVWSNSASSQDVTFGLCIQKVLPPIITDTKRFTPTQLVEEVLFGTSCASVTNVVSSTGTNFGSVNGIGYFNKSLSEFQFKDGVILSTGDALRAPGPNNFILKDGSAAWKGDIDVNVAMGIQSWNASVLEFDFVPFADKISFNFLFASEEYGQFQCDYSDTFLFILTDKVNGTKKNLAVIPTTDIPVSVVTIRDEEFNPFCSSENPEYFDHYYMPGYPHSIPGIGAPTNYNGITKPMVASSGVIPGRAYHIKMVIADRADTAYDSSVFLEGGSFNIGAVELGSDITGVNALCAQETMTLSTGLDPIQYHITWFKDDVLIPGENGADYVVTGPGKYSVDAQFGSSTCHTTDSIVIEYYQEALPGTPNNLSVCDTSGFGVFDLTQNAPLILAPFASSTYTYTLNYFTSKADADNNVNAIADPANFQNTVNPQTIFVRINNSFIECYQVVSFELTVKVDPPKFVLSGATAICPEASTTISVLPENNDYDPAKVTYSWTFNGNVLNESSSSLVISTSAGYGPYTVSVTNGGCVGVKSFDITNSNTIWDVAFVNQPYVICPGQSVQLSFTALNFDIDNPNAEYTWTAPNGDKSNGKTLAANQIGEYTLEINIDGCISSETVSVTENTDTIAIEILPGCDGNEFKLVAKPLNNSFDPVNSTYVWQEADGKAFTVVVGEPNTIILTNPGEYSVTVTNTDGCSATETLPVSNVLCSIQKGITPNGDTKNDSFVLSDAKKLEIFNRYGSKVYSQNDYTNQWHGQTDGGQDLPDGTYYYVVERSNGDTLTGWIYILR